MDEWIDNGNILYRKINKELDETGSGAGRRATTVRTRGQGGQPSAVGIRAPGARRRHAALDPALPLSRQAKVVPERHSKSARKRREPRATTSISFPTHHRVPLLNFPPVLLFLFVCFTIFYYG